MTQFEVTRAFTWTVEAESEDAARELANTAALPPAAVHRGETVVMPQDASALESFAMRVSPEAGVEVTAEFRGEAVKAWCGIAIDWFRDIGAKGYVTMDLTDARDGQKYTMTMQRHGGASPSDKIGELRAEIARLTAPRIIVP